MSDFLARMAERALRQAPVVEPLVRSRYEPVQTLVPEETAMSPVTAPPLAPLPAAPPEARPVEPAAPPPARPRRASGVPRPDAVEEPAAHGPVSAPARGELAADAPKQPPRADVSPPPRDGDAESAPRVLVTLPEVEPLEVEELLTALPAATTPRERDYDAQVPPHGQAAPRGGSRGAGPDALAVEGAPGVVRVGVRPAETERLELVAPRPPEGAQPRVAGRTQPSRPQPEPVRVTIGRVEVVAPPAPAPAPAPDPPGAPRLSLDEYLRTRGLGR